MKVKKIIFKNYIERECEGYTTFDDERIVFIGKNGVVITDSEFIHNKNDLLTDSYRVYVCKVHDENTIPLCANGYIAEQFSILLDNADTEEVEATDFFRSPNYNSRLSENFSGIIKSLNEIKYEEVSDFVSAFEK